MPVASALSCRKLEYSKMYTLAVCVCVCMCVLVIRLIRRPASGLDISYTWLLLRSIEKKSDRLVRQRFTDGDGDDGLLDDGSSCGLWPHMVSLVWWSITSHLSVHSTIFKAALFSKKKTLIFESILRNAILICIDSNSNGVCFTGLVAH